MTQTLILFYTLLAFGLSTFLLQFYYFIGHDGVFYVRMAQNLFSGGGISVNPGEPYTGHPPFYSILIGLVNFFLKDLEFSGHLISMLAFAFTLIPLFLIARRVYPPNTAHWVSLLYATHGFLLIHSHLVMPETLFVLLTVIQLYFVLGIIRGSDRALFQGFLFGGVSGMAYLTRPEGLLYYVAGIFAIFLLSSRPWTNKGRILGVSLATFLILILPYVGFIYRSTHKFQMSTEVARLFVLRQMDVSHPQGWLEVKKVFWGLTEDKRRLKADELAENFNLLDSLKKDHFALPRSFLPAFFTIVLKLGYYLFGGLGFLFMGASWFGVPWDGQRKRSELVFLFFLLTFLPQLLGFFLAKRYLLIFPLLLIWMGNGIEVLRDWAKKSFGLNERKSVGLALGVCLIFILPSAWYLYHTLRRAPVPQEPKQMGAWLKENDSRAGEKKLAARHPAVNFYSGTRFVWLPYVDNLKDLHVYLAHQGAKYFVVSEDLDPPFLEAYRPLLDEKRPPPGMIRRHIVTGKIKMILYEVT